MNTDTSLQSGTTAAAAPLPPSTPYASSQGGFKYESECESLITFMV